MNLFLWQPNRSYSYAYLKSFLPDITRCLRYLIDIGFVRKKIDYKNKFALKHRTLYQLDVSFPYIKELQGLALARMKNQSLAGCFSNSDFALMSGYFIPNLGDGRDIELYLVGDYDRDELRRRTLLPISPRILTKREAYLLYMSLDPKFTWAYEHGIYLKKLHLMSKPQFKYTNLIYPQDEFRKLVESRLKCVNSSVGGSLSNFFTEEDTSMLLRYKMLLEDLLGATLTLTDFQKQIESLRK